MITTIIVSAMTLVGTVMAAYLTYRSAKSKTLLDADGGLRAEIQRLREDLADRDLEARLSHNEVLELRGQVLQLNMERMSRELLIAELQSTVAQLLQRVTTLEELEQIHYPKTEE